MSCLAFPVFLHSPEYFYGRSGVFLEGLLEPVKDRGYGCVEIAWEGTLSISLIIVS